MPSSAPKVPKASAENSTPSVRSKVTMASGQCTIGAPTKVTVCRPKEKVSPSFTSMHSWSSTWKPNCRMSMKAFSLEMTFTLGCRSKISSMQAA